VGKIVTRIGEAANVVVKPAKSTPPALDSYKAGAKKRRKATRTADYIATSSSFRTTYGSYVPSCFWTLAF
jgi:hypothetical protein